MKKLGFKCAALMCTRQGKNRVEENKMCIIFIRKQLLNFGVDEYAIMNNGFVLFFLFSGES